MGIARRIAHLTYRTESEMDVRFGRQLQGDETGRYAVESYLDHQAVKLAKRFDANTYIALTDAMNSHDIGRDRGGVAKALEGITVPVVVVSIDTDRLFPPRLQVEISELVPTAAPQLLSNLSLDMMDFWLSLRRWAMRFGRPCRLRVQYRYYLEQFEEM